MTGHVHWQAMIRAGVWLAAWCASSASADCRLDIQGKWRVSHTASTTGAERQPEEMPAEFTFRPDGRVHVFMGFFDAESPYDCEGNTVTIRKAEPSVLAVVQEAPDRLHWVEKGSSRVFYLQRQ